MKQTERNTSTVQFRIANASDEVEKELIALQDEWFSLPASDDISTDEYYKALKAFLEKNASPEAKKYMQHVKEISEYAEKNGLLI